MNLLRQMLVVAWHTWRSVIRRPIVPVLTISGLLIMAGLPCLVVFSLGDENRLVRDGVLALLLLNGALVSVAASATVFYRAAPGDDLALIICKPVSRPALPAGRYLGLLFVAVWFMLISLPAAQLAERASLPVFSVELPVVGLVAAAPLAALLWAAANNFRRRSSFIEAVALALLPAMVIAFLIALFLPVPEMSAVCSCGAHHAASMTDTCMWRMLPAGALILLALMLLTAWVVCWMVRVSMPLALSGLFVILAAGLLSEYLLARWSGSRLTEVLLRLLPHWQDYWMADALAHGGVIAWSYVGWMLGYTALYCAALICLAAGLFVNVEPR
ncbi:MAG: hypothetical protein LC725_06545 [Lentisphaerae bacterium]|nr:hypothetical protein [Lentisphaerota bacterium]